MFVWFSNWRLAKEHKKTQTMEYYCHLLFSSTFKSLWNFIFLWKIWNYIFVEEGMQKDTNNVFFVFLKRLWNFIFLWKIWNHIFVEEGMQQMTFFFFKRLWNFIFFFFFLCKLWNHIFVEEGMQESHSAELALRDCGIYEITLCLRIKRLWNFNFFCGSY